MSTVIRVGGAVVGSVLGASAASVYSLRDTSLDFDNFTTHVRTPGGAFGALVGGFAGYSLPEIMQGLEIMGGFDNAASALDFFS
jgi:hypothetical protein